jgi:outer membrane murein-binding lipoprotein Lpp
MLSTVTKLAPAVVILLAAPTLGGCATKKYVREQIEPVSARVSTLETQLQATDGTAKQALAEAQAASGQLQQNGQRLDQLNGRVDGVEQRLQEQERRGKRPRH